MLFFFNISTKTWNCFFTFHWINNLVVKRNFHCLYCKMTNCFWFKWQILNVKLMKHLEEWQLITDYHFVIEFKNFCNIRNISSGMIVLLIILLHWFIIVDRLKNKRNYKKFYLFFGLRRMHEKKTLIYPKQA